MHFHALYGNTIVSGKCEPSFNKIVRKFKLKYDCRRSFGEKALSPPSLQFSWKVQKLAKPNPPRKCSYMCVHDTFFKLIFKTA